MTLNNMFSTWFNSWFWTGGGFGSGGWLNQATKDTVKTPTKQQKFPWLNAQQIANIEKVTANLTWAEKNQEQQKLYQAMIQAIESENFTDNRIAVNNERYRNSLSKTDNRECKFDQSACRQSTLVDMIKSARNLRANTDEDTVMKMFMQEMEVKWIDMDKLNNYLDNGDETILYEAWLKTNQWGTKDLVNQAYNESNGILPKGSEWLNPVWAVTETVDNAANSFANKIMITWEWAAENLKSKIQNMSKEEVEQYRKQYEKLLADKDWRVAKVKWNTLVEQLWNGLVKGEKYYDYDDEDFMKWLISQKASLWESLIWADDMLKWEHNPNVIKFFGNIPWSALKTFTATVRWMSNPYDTLKWLYTLAATEEWHQALLSRYWSWDALADAMNTDPVGVADDALAVAQIVTAWARGWTKLAWKVTWNQSLVNAANNIPTVWSVNDALASKTLWTVYGWMDKLANASNSKVVKWINTYLQDTSNVSKAYQDIKESWVWQAVTNFKDEMIEKVVGVNKEDREFIRNNPELVNEYLDWKKNVDTVYNDVKEKLNDKALEKIETGEEYNNLTKSKKKSVNTKWLTQDKGFKKNLKDNWITIDADWNLQFKQPSEFDAKQQKAIQDAWEVIKEVDSSKKIDNKTALWQRKKLDNKINWEWKPDKMSSSDIDTENVIKNIRRNYNNYISEQIPWLKELDAKYQPLIDEVKQMRKDRFNPDWTIKDNARSKIRNMTKAWNEARLERLEKIAPWITNDLKALDVWLTVQRATSQWVWQYAKGWLITAWITTAIHNPLLWIPMAIAWVFATPKNFVKLIEAYPDIWNKIQNWIKLTPEEITKMQGLAARIADTEKEQD